MRTNLLVPALALLLPGAAIAQSPLPLDTSIHSGQKGEMPAIARESVSTGSTLVVTFNEVGPGDLWRWEPFNAFAASLGRSNFHCDGDDYQIACGVGTVEAYDLGGAWYTIGTGNHPSSDGYVVAWDDLGTGPDPGISWYDRWVGVTHTVLDGNGLYEDFPVIDGFTIVYQVHNGFSWDVGLWDTYTNSSLGTVPDLGDETRPDMVAGFLAYESPSYGGIAWYDRINVSTVAVPTPGTACTSYAKPRLGGSGYWVVYEGIGCPSGGSELYLADMKTGSLYFVDRLLAPAHEYPNYAIRRDMLAYADDNGEIVLADIDAASLGAGLPGKPVPVTTDWHASRLGRNVAVSIDAGQPWVTFSDSSTTWSWDPIGGSITSTASPGWSRFDGQSVIFVAWDGTEIQVSAAGSTSWSSLGKGLRPTVYEKNVAWIDDSVSPDLAISYDFGGSTGTVLDHNGLDEGMPQLWGDWLVYEVDYGGNWDVEIYDLAHHGPITSFPNLGQERNPDIYEKYVVADIDHRDIVRFDFGSGTTDYAALPPGCAQYTHPRLGMKGDWVVFTAWDCPSNANELWLYNYANKNLWFVDQLGSFGDPTYHIVDDQLVYVNDSSEVVLLDLDETSI